MQRPLQDGGTITVSVPAIARYRFDGHRVQAVVAIGHIGQLSTARVAASRASCHASSAGETLLIALPEWAFEIAAHVSA